MPKRFTKRRYWREQHEGRRNHTNSNMNFESRHRWNDDSPYMSIPATNSNYSHQSNCDGASLTSSIRSSYPQHGYRRNRNKSHRPGPSAGKVEAKDEKEDDLEIPGFYYDKEKRKYFRLLPGHNNYNPLTVDSIKKKEIDKMKKDLSQSKQGSSTTKYKNTGESEITEHFQCELPVPMFQHSLQIGHYSSQQVSRLQHERMVNSVQTNTPMQLTASHLLNYRYSHLMADVKNDVLCTVIEFPKSCCLCLGELIPVKNPRTNGPIQFLDSNDVVKDSKVTCVCWAGPGSSAETAAVLYSSFKSESGISEISSFSTNPRHNIRFSYTLHSTAWTCAWSNNHQFPNKVAIGASRKALMVDVQTQRALHFNTHKSDVFTQTFGLRNPLLINGTRKGHILGFDLREPSNRSSCIKLQQELSVCCVKFLTDENYLVASDMASKILLWDIRALKPVIQFHGHTNTHLQLSFHIDSTESVIYSGGMDTLIRFWSLQDGHLIRTVAPPFKEHYRPPLVQYSEEWTKDNFPGIVMANEKDLHWCGI